MAWFLPAQSFDKWAVAHLKKRKKVSLFQICYGISGDLIPLESPPRNHCMTNDCKKKSPKACLRPKMKSFRLEKWFARNISDLQRRSANNVKSFEESCSSSCRKE